MEQEMAKSLDNISDDVYYENIELNAGEYTMTTRGIIEDIMKATDSTQVEIAEKIGWTAQKLWSRLDRDTLKVKDLIAILESYDLEMVIANKATGEEIKPSGMGRRVRCVVDYVLYDTAASEALSNNFYADGENEYNDGKALELYIDKEGRYFFAEYSCWEGVKDRISPVSAEVAAEFIQKYGTVIQKGPRHRN